MVPAHVVEIITPKKYVLNGLWFGPAKPTRAVVFVHGLTGSAFSMRHVVSALSGGSTAVLAFNNKGFGKVNTVKRKAKGKRRASTMGSAHEVFTDCTDDIEGAVRFARRQGSREVYIAGHSTGCQKAVYWAAKGGGRGVRGIVLLAPVSDRAAALKRDKKGHLSRALAHARKLVRAGKKHELMPRKFLTSWSLDDAQRFLSLYGADSPESIFCYEQPDAQPRTLRAVSLPMLAVWAQRDEYADRSASAIREWFLRHMNDKSSFLCIPDAEHGFKGAERSVAKAIRRFMKEAGR